MADATLAEINQTRSIANYTNLLRNLLPVGIIWKYLSDTMWDFLESFAVEMYRLDGRCIDILNEGIPGLSTELIDRWEQVVLLPDEIPAEGTALAERQNIVHTKYYTYPQSPTEQFFIDYALELGITVTFSAYPQFRVGTARVGDRISGERASVYIIVVDHSGGTTAQKRAMKAYFLRMKPAHTSMEFNPPIT